MESSPNESINQKENSSKKVLSRSLVKSLAHIHFKLSYFVEHTSKLAEFLQNRISDSSKGKPVDAKNLFRLLDEIKKDFQASEIENFVEVHYYEKVPKSFECIRKCKGLE